MTDPVSLHPHQAQQSLDLIQEELSKETGNADLIENSSLMSQTVRVILLNDKAVDGHVLQGYM